MLEAALSTSPLVTRLLVGAPPCAPRSMCRELPPGRRNMPARALCITIPDDRGDESFADDLNMGRGIVSGRVALLLRSTEIRPHRPNDLLPPSLIHPLHIHPTFSNSRVPLDGWVLGLSEPFPPLGTIPINHLPFPVQDWPDPHPGFFQSSDIGGLGLPMGYEN